VARTPPGRRLGPRGLRTRRRLLDATAELLCERGMRGEAGLANARVLVSAFLGLWDAHHAVLRVRSHAAEEGARTAPVSWSIPWRSPGAATKDRVREPRG
jgi:hypothetical protein